MIAIKIKDAKVRDALGRLIDNLPKVAKRISYQCAKFYSQALKETATRPYFAFPRGELKRSIKPIKLTTYKAGIKMWSYGPIVSKGAPPHTIYPNPLLKKVQDWAVRAKFEPVGEVKGIYSEAVTPLRRAFALAEAIWKYGTKPTEFIETGINIGHEYIRDYFDTEGRRLLR